jgi:exodeoxyribonuclease V gamma subunit
MLTLITSNRMEALSRQLADAIRAPLRSAFQPELVLVQSQGMARWLKLELAEHQGVCCNCHFPFPRVFSSALFHGVLPDMPQEALYDPDMLVWRVMKELPTVLETPGFEGIKNYVGADSDRRKLFQLSDKIANVFDQYLIFRPEQIQEWEAGNEDHWQARLWREVSKHFQQQHPAILHARFVERLEKAPGPVIGLPERISIFGISALPPFYMRFFAALARHTEVNLFLLEPCREFWGYISSDREQEKTLRRHGGGASATEALHLEQGNRLLASTGQLGRDFLVLVQEAGDLQESDESLFSDPGENTILSSIQSDILYLRDRGRGDTDKKVISEEDTSIQVHSCHSPLREMEVLYDHLLNWFEKDPTLAPRDILVMIPEIEIYAPYIRAVFDSPEQERLRIPYSLADRSARGQSHVIETFLGVLNLVGTRLGVASVVALLESDPIRRKFDLTENDLEIIRHWVSEIRINWGRDQEQRSDLGLPSWEENTWKHGLDRLLMGYAMAGGGAKLFLNILPYDDVEGSTAAVLGKFAAFVEKLFGALKAMEGQHALDHWVEKFQAILTDFFEVGEDQASDLEVLYGSFDKFSRAQETTGYDQPVELSVVLEQLNRDLSQDHFGSGYLTGGVTFCALKPMRSIPAKIICLLGMNDGVFPRANGHLSFDLMAQKPKLGDRSSREDDRYLFLETLISARERLYLSYVGQSIRDNREAPPSVLVSELLDYISQGFELAGRDVIKDHVFTQNRLQAFSTAYFCGGRLFSYSRENLQASQATVPARSLPAPFISKPLPEPEPEWRRLTAKTLSEFLCHPSKFLATRRLGISLNSPEAALQEREPFDLNDLENYLLKEELLGLKLVNNVRVEDSRDLVRASGRLPAGKTGDAYHAQIGWQVESFCKILQAYKPNDFEPMTSFDLAVDEFSISGDFSQIVSAGMLFYRPAKIKGKDLLRAWVGHLLWNASDRRGKSAETFVLGTESIYKFAAVAEPLPLLRQVLDMYWTGLSAPRKFFPESSYAFAGADFKARQGRSGRITKTPIVFAQEKWNGTDYGPPGECEDSYFSLFFKNVDPLDNEFEDLARTTLDPLFGVLEEIKP